MKRAWSAVSGSRLSSPALAIELQQHAKLLLHSNSRLRRDNKCTLLLADGGSVCLSRSPLLAVLIAKGGLLAPSAFNCCTVCSANCSAKEFVE